MTEDEGHLTGGEELGVAMVVARLQLGQQRRAAVDPAHQVVDGNAGSRLGEIECGQLLFAIGSDSMEDAHIDLIFIDLKRYVVVTDT